MSDVIIVIGASGGIGQELVHQLSERYPDNTIYALSRKSQTASFSDNVRCMNIRTDDEKAIHEFCQSLDAKDQKVRLAISTVGILHGEVDGLQIAPEKRLEDIDNDQLLRYFHVNSVVPTLWLKHLVDRMSDQPSQIVCFSARVGSISDNRLGGWYGYRASKAALNMLLKTAAVEYGRRAKSTTLLSYHPGTVDTGLSEPFQRNVKPEKLFTPEFTVSQLLSLLPKLRADQSPYFMDWEHEVVTW